MPFGIPLYALWLGAAILFGVLEAVLLGLNSIWFTLGALAAMAAALLGAGLGIQVLLFLVVSLAALVLAKRFLKERFNPRRQHTNADRILGSRALVTETIDDARETGAIRCGGLIWTARSLSGQPIPAGSTVCVRSIDGVKAMVSPIPEPPAEPPAQA